MKKIIILSAIFIAFISSPVFASVIDTTQADPFANMPHFLLKDMWSYSEGKGIVAGHAPLKRYKNTKGDYTYVWDIKGVDIRVIVDGIVHPHDGYPGFDIINNKWQIINFKANAVSTSTGYEYFIDGVQGQWVVDKDDPRHRETYVYNQGEFAVVTISMKSINRGNNQYEVGWIFAGIKIRQDIN